MDVMSNIIITFCLLVILNTVLFQKLTDYLIEDIFKNTKCKWYEASVEKI